MRFTSLTLAFFCATSVIFLRGAEIGADAAREYASEWLSHRRSFKSAKVAAVSQKTAVRTVKDSGDKTLFHVVRLEGNGFVVVAGDDEITPIIAFSENGQLVEDEANPLWILLNRDLGMRRALISDKKVAPNAVATTKSTESGSVKTGVSGIDDMRVEPLVKSQWDQTTIGGKAVYNYHTPSEMPCGCVATAAAQVMRFHEYPREKVTQATYSCEISSKETNLTTIGGVYDWTLMPLIPDSSVTDSEREMIGRLVYDVGVASCMSYGNSGSGTIAYYTAQSLKSLFHYNQAVYAEQFGSKTGVMDVLENTLLANFDAGCPVMMGISGKDMSTRQNVGHEIVGDGYGYIDDALYVHLNLGWSGDWDAWYNLPEIDAYVGRVGCDFNLFDDVVYNVFPDGGDVEILSGRVLGVDGNAIAGAYVWATDENGAILDSTSTSEYGVYALKVAAISKCSVNARVDTLLGGRVNVTMGKSTTYTTYFGETHADSLEASVGNRWGNDIVIDAGTCSAPVFSHESCAFVDSIAVECSKDDDGATVRYTLDGTVPDADSPEWPEGGVVLRHSATLTARAFRSGMTDSAVVSATYTDHPQPQIANGVISWTAPIGAKYYKVFRAENRFGTEVTECSPFITETSFSVAVPDSAWDTAFYFVCASSEPEDSMLSPLSDAIACVPGDSTDGAVQVQSFVGVAGGTNETFCIPDFPATISAVYYTTTGAFGDKGFFKVNVPTTSRKNISIPENSEMGYIKTTKVISSAKFGEANGTLFMSSNAGSGEPRRWSISLCYEQGGETNWAGKTECSATPVCFHCFQQCEATLGLSCASDEIRGHSTNLAVNVACPREYTWSAVSDADWIAVLRPVGRGACPLRLQVEGNTEDSPRTGRVTVTCGTNTVSYTLSQAAHEDVVDPVEPVPGEIALVATQGTKYTSVLLHWSRIDGAVAYSIYRAAASSEIPDAPSWVITNSIPAFIDFSASPGLEYRYWVQAETAVGKTEPSSPAIGWRASQIDAGATSTQFGATGGVERIVVYSNAGWLADTDADWLTLYPVDTERNGVLDIMAESNATGAERSASIILIGGASTLHPATNCVTVVQSAIVRTSSGEGSEDVLDSADGDATAWVRLEMKDGSAVVDWRSELPVDEQGDFEYVLWGSQTLGDSGKWKRLDEIDDATRRELRYFKVTSRRIK